MSADSSVPDVNPSRSRLDAVVRRYYAPLLSFFRRRTRNSPDVQDLVQQVFLRLAQHPHVGAIRNPDAYIFQTAANALRDHARRGEIRQRHVHQLLAAHAGDSPESRSALSPERVLQGEQSIVQLAAALRELPERTRDIFLLRCFEGLKHAEIARLHGISVRAAEKHYARALAHLTSVVDQDPTQQGREPPL